MTILTWDLLKKFRSARFSGVVITFDDIVKERNIIYHNEEYHMWLARKDKKEYLINNEDLELPLKILDTKVIKEDKSIYHFVTKSDSVGFKAEKHFDYKELIDKLSSAEHTNKLHQKLLWIIAESALRERINARICSNIEFGKDGTFIVLNYLTNVVGLYDNPETRAKLEYGLLNRLLVINELVPKSQERHNIDDFLKSIGTMSPEYVKKTRQSSSGGIGEITDVNRFSLLICYNILKDISKVDNENYFDYVFGNNVIKRFPAFKFNGKIKIQQFSQDKNYNIDVDKQILDIARTLTYYQVTDNWKKELKQFRITNIKVILSDRERFVINRISNGINLYSSSIEEFELLINELLRCYVNYQNMIRGNNNIVNNQEKLGEVSDGDGFEELHPEVIEISIQEDDGNHSSFPELHHPLDPIDFIRKNGRNGEIDIDLFLNNYSEDVLNNLVKTAQVFKPRVNIIKILE